MSLINPASSGTAAPAAIPPPTSQQPERGRAGWTVTERAAVVNAVMAGTLTEKEAEARYGLSPEEIAAWQRTLNSLGRRGVHAPVAANETASPDKVAPRRKT